MQYKTLTLGLIQARPAHPRPFSAYDDITKKLIRRGIPAEQIAADGDADSDAKKQALFEKVRNGAVRVLIGSTAKMGPGRTCRSGSSPSLRDQLRLALSDHPPERVSVSELAGKVTALRAGHAVEAAPRPPPRKPAIRPVRPVDPVTEPSPVAEPEEPSFRERVAVRALQRSLF